MTAATAGTTGIRPRQTWAPLWVVPTVVLGATFVLIGLTSPLQEIKWPAIIGGLLVVGALLLATRSRLLAIGVLVVGAVLPVVTTWWSLVVPLTAVLILVCGSLAIRAMRPLTASPKGGGS